MCGRSELSATPTGELWELARNGDRAAYAALVLRHSPQMRASLRAIVARSRHWTRARPEDIPDLLQELHVLLLSRGPGFLACGADSPEVDVELAFRVAATRMARSYLRSGRRSAWAEIPSTGDVEVLAVAERTEEALLARDRLRRAFMGTGVARAQAIVRAIYIEGQSLDEVCQCWRVTRNSVYCTAKRFRAYVRALEATEGRRQGDGAASGTCPTRKGVASGSHQRT